MRTSDGQKACSGRGKTSKSESNCQIPEPLNPITPTQIEFLNLIISYGAEGLSHSLKQIHEIALYESNCPIDKDEKLALSHMKFLWEGLDKLD